MEYHCSDFDMISSRNQDITSKKSDVQRHRNSGGQLRYLGCRHLPRPKFMYGYEVGQIILHSSAPDGNCKRKGWPMNH